MANANILIVDDDSEDRQQLSEEFVRQKPEVSIKLLEGGNELLRYLNECPVGELPLMIVLDYQMPELSGPQTLLRLSANSCFKRIIKVMWSTSRRTQDIEDCQRLGASHYFVKPGTMKELNKAVHELTAIFEMAVHTVR